MTTAFDPIVLGGTRLANRLVMAPMTRSRAYGPGAEPTGLMATYYAQRPRPRWQPPWRRCRTSSSSRPSGSPPPASPTAPPSTPSWPRVDVREDLPGIQAPTLVISTTQDRFTSTRPHHQLADTIPGAQLVEIPTGHLPMVERPEEWQQIITDFLDRHRPSRPAGAARTRPRTAPVRRRGR